MSKRAALFVLFTLIAALPAVALAQAPATTPTPPAMTAGATDSLNPTPQPPPPTDYFGSTTPAAGATAPVPPANIETLNSLGVISASGAVQFLFQARQQDANQPKVERFLTRRVQLSVFGQPTEKIRYGIVLDGVDGDLIDPAANGFRLRVREAWIGYDPLPWLAFDVGSFRPPWTLTMDDQVSDEILIRYPLLLTQNQFTPWRQTGGMVTARGGRLFTVSAGLWNGIDAPDNFTDTNEKKDQMVTVMAEFAPGVRLYIGDWRGENMANAVAGSTTGADMNNIWLGTEIEKGGFNLAAEALWNRLSPDTGSDTNSFGYQVSLAYTWHMIQPVLRYEQFDPDNAVTADELEWTTLGLNIMLNPSTRLMTNYIFKAERMDNDVANDELLIQISAWF